MACEVPVTRLSPTANPIPLEAQILGVGGLIPLVAGVAAHIATPEPFGFPLVRTILTYAALVLAFLGGIHWGFASSAFAHDANRSEATRVLALSVLPAFAGWIVVLLPAAIGAPILAVAFVWVLLLDRASAGLGYAPSWWMHLRIRLTAGVVILLLILGATGMLR